MTNLIFYAVLAAAMYYLGSRAKITEWLWSKYSDELTKFMDCSACTGFWWGFLISGTVGRVFEVDIGWAPWWHPVTPMVVGLSCVVLVPMVASLMQMGLDRLGSVLPPDED